MLSALDPDPRAYVPHRPPILCVDAVEDATETRAVTTRVVPDHAVVRGGIWEPWLIEGLAQTAAVLRGRNDALAGRHTKKGMLVGMRNFTIHRRPGAGERIRFEATLIKQLTPLTLIEGTARVGDEVVAVGDLKFYVETTP